MTPLVLLAEDNVVNQKVAVAMLERIGFRADVVPNGADAIDAAMRGGYSAVLMDLQMPGVNGYEATVEIRRREEGKTRIPIIAMTAAAMEGEREKCLAAGMDDYISKPVKLDELDVVLRKWVVGGIEATARTEDADQAFIDSADPIDPARIEELRELRGKEARDAFLVLAEIFRVDGRFRLAGIQEAMLSDDSEAVADEAHALMGSAANLGAAVLADRCKDLEQLGQTGRLVGGGELLARLEEEFQRVDEFLAAFLEG